MFGFKSFFVTLLSFSSVVLSEDEATSRDELSSDITPDGGYYYGRPPPPPPPSAPCVMYEVRPGDYCYKIALVNGISYRQLLRQNPGLDCTRLYAGQSICLYPFVIPGNEDMPKEDIIKSSSTTCKKYIVKDGDLCLQIAHAQQITVNDLIEKNKDAKTWGGCNNLFIGQELCV